ncbi:Fumarate hydratase class I, aerobic [Sporotomaculum syntrophicum]|uniref:Fumarate hydratase class I, aerobic n=2 Tax=Sporotomaculum syntrophicum TaxID=182264 RepID=A0A9D2WND3_9FIRM|nr:Fumarate hydratase class I, aerobic [Sporotomaculum syntrophicum]
MLENISMTPIRLKTPVTDDIIKQLRIGQKVLINGFLYTGRDAAHAKLVALIDNGQDLPITLNGQIIYYAGPSPAKPGRIIGSVGPTTSGRMDLYAPKLIALGLKGMVGKGKRSPEVIKAIKQYNSVYFAAVGGAAALISKTVKQCEVVAYPELGPEAIYRLAVEDFPVIVVNDTQGGDLYEEGIKMYAATS